jgi:hypothetical protein
LLLPPPHPMATEMTMAKATRLRMVRHALLRRAGMVNIRMHASAVPPAVSKRFLSG